jgi:hypothetical protein
LLQFPEQKFYKNPANGFNFPEATEERAAELQNKKNLIQYR